MTTMTQGLRRTREEIRNAAMHEKNAVDETRRVRIVTARAAVMRIRRMNEDDVVANAKKNAVGKKRNVTNENTAVVDAEMRTVMVRKMAIRQMRTRTVNPPKKSDVIVEIENDATRRSIENQRVAIRIVLAATRPTVPMRIGANTAKKQSVGATRNPNDVTKKRLPRSPLWRHLRFKGHEKVISFSKVQMGWGIIWTRNQSASQSTNPPTGMMC
mmetsp:Transcript_33753/g.70166  ORF Transcript_33753/g.70166 Transcript_33753/m.70166 type:complete len:214 (+) Transcript_33753:397-1038(+)